MEITANSKQVRTSPRKIRLVADLIRNSSVDQALEKLTVVEKRGSYALEKTLKSAIANALNNSKMTKESLTIKKIEISEGPALKRFHPSSRGRVHPYKRRSTNIKIVLEGGEK